MKVQAVSLTTVAVPVQPFLAGGIEWVSRIPFVLVQVRTEDGVEGLGYAFSMSRAAFPALHALLKELGALLVGRDPTRVEDIQRELRRAAGWIGPGGLLDMALAALDIACWDIIGKGAGMPLWRLLGGSRPKVPTYASGALWRNYTLKEIAETGPRLVEQGFRSMKLRLGQEPTLEQEEARVRTLREAVGYGVQVLVDINQGWTVSQAIAAGRMLERYQVGWLEDPVPHQDIPGLIQVAHALDMPVCAGEYYYGIRPLAEVVAHQAVDILMIDLLRVGGITPWRKAAAIAEAYHRPVASHLLPEIAVHLIAAVPNGYTVEYMPWSLPLFAETPRLEDGLLVAPERPGHGLVLDEVFVRAHPTE